MAFKWENYIQKSIWTLHSCHFIKQEHIKPSDIYLKKDKHSSRKNIKAI